MLNKIENLSFWQHLLKQSGIPGVFLITAIFIKTDEYEIYIKFLLIILAFIIATIIIIQAFISEGKKDYKNVVDMATQQTSKSQEQTNKSQEQLTEIATKIAQTSSAWVPETEENKTIIT